MQIRTQVNQFVLAGEIVCEVEIVDDGTVIATGHSRRGGAGLAPADNRSVRDHLFTALHEAKRSMRAKADAAADLINAMMKGNEP